MGIEMLAALRRIEAVAYWHVKEVTDPTELKDALQYITEEVGLLIHLVKQEQCDHTFERDEVMINVCTKCGIEGEQD